MALYELVLPKMGESVAEATIIKWVKQAGDLIEIDESILEIATDKVDSEVPSPVAGKLIKVLYKEDDVVQVGALIAVIETDLDDQVEIYIPEPNEITVEETIPVEVPIENLYIQEVKDISIQEKNKPVNFSTTDRFYSPLVKSMAAEEEISFSELNSINGTGSEGRVTKQDILDYIKINKTQENDTLQVQKVVQNQQKL